MSVGRRGWRIAFVENATECDQLSNDGSNPMKRTPGFCSLVAMLMLAGCDGSSTSSISISSNIGDAVTNETSDGAIDIATDEGSADVLLDQFAGATFVSANLLEDADRGLTPSHWLVSFTNDTVTWTQSELLELGTFPFAAGSRRDASFSDRKISFNSSGNDMIWDSQTYYRLSSSQFDSTETLVANFGGATFNSIEIDNVSLRFEGNQLFISELDTVRVGAYSFTDSQSFNTNFGGSDSTAYPLFNDRLLVDSVLYERDFSDLFDSQESLVAFLDGASYRSADLRPIGESSDGIASIGHWFIDFTDNNFIFSAQNGDEAGTVVFISSNAFSAVFDDREYVVETQGDDILWNGVRYIKQ